MLWRMGWSFTIFYAFYSSIVRAVFRVLCSFASNCGAVDMEKNRTLLWSVHRCCASPRQVLQDLQTDEELKTLLGSEVERQSRLVRVDIQHLERVLELLHERGFSIDD